MIPLIGPFSEFAKRRFDRKCERAALSVKHSVAIKMAVGVLVTSVLIFICLGAEVVRETAITNTAEQKAQSEDGGQSLADENPDYAGWLTVEGTSISTPVVSCRQGDPKGFYLNHGFDRTPSFSGCPYIAEGSSPESSNMLVYGHNMGIGSLAFSALQNCYRKDCFSSIGTVTFKEKDGKASCYTPLYGLRVPMSYDLLLRFDFAGESDFDAWLNSLAERANAKSSYASSDSVITLVTCSSAIGGSRYRSVLICERMS